MSSTLLGCLPRVEVTTSVLLAAQVEIGGWDTQLGRGSQVAKRSVRLKTVLLMLVLMEQ